MRWLAPILALALGGCITVDGFFFNPSGSDGYDFDSGEDPELQGELTDLHPSLIDAEHRLEGFEDTERGRVHWVLAQRDGATDAILYSHGNTANVGRYWDRVERLWGLGFTVLIYDYPGYGLSEGEPGEEAVFVAAQVALERLAAQPEVERVWLYGYSLDSAPSFELAARAERGDAPEVTGLITEAAWCSVEDLLQDGASVSVPGHFATDLVMDSCARASELERVPILLMHGTEDRVIEPRHATLLERAAADVDVTVRRVEGAVHVDVPLVAGADYDAWIVDFTR